MRTACWPNWPRSTPAPAERAASTAPGFSTTALALARSLGFDTVITHTRDAMWRVDDLIAVLAIGTSLISNQSKLAEDLEIFSSSEFNFVDLDDSYSRSSVLMPQKRNPYALSIVRGASGVLIGRLTGFLAVTKSPSARSDNFIFAYGEVPRALDLALRVTALMTGVVRTLQVNPDRMREELDEGLRAVDRPGRAPHPDPRHRLPHRLLRRRRRRARREPSRHPRARPHRGHDQPGRARRAPAPAGDCSTPTSRQCWTRPRSWPPGRSVGGAARRAVEQMLHATVADAAAVAPTAAARGWTASPPPRSDLLGRARSVVAGGPDRGPTDQRTLRWSSP